MLKHIPLLISLILYSVASQAAPTQFKIIPAESSIKFEAEQTGKTVHGEFKKFDADINFDPAALDKSSAKVTIDMGSFTIDDVSAKGELKQSAYFDIKKFPQAVFETTSFKVVGNKRYVAVANLTIKGHSEPIILEFTLHEFSKDKAYMTGEVTLKRRVFKIGDEDVQTVGDNVKVFVTIKATGSGS